jgi:hypothetical protein
VTPSCVAGHLRHHLLGDRVRQPLRAGPGIVLRVDHGGGGQGVVPAVAADGVEERVQRADVFRVVGPAGQFVLQDCKVALDQVPVDLPQSLDRDLGRGQILLGAALRRRSVADRPATVTLGDV